MDVTDALEAMAADLEAKARKLRSLAAKIRSHLTPPSAEYASTDTKLRKLGLSTRSKRVLCQNEGFETVGDLIHYSDSYFLRLIGFGRSGLKELRGKIGPAHPPVLDYDKPRIKTPEPHFRDTSAMDFWFKHPSETEQQYNDRLALLAAAMAEEDAPSNQG